MDSTSSTSKTAASTPGSSPGLYSPSPPPPPPPQRQFATLGDGIPTTSPYLHPLQMHKVRETHKAQVEQDFITGRKLINQYEIIDEIGRGVHGKVKLARSLETGDYVAIKIIQRFSKKRRLGKVTVAPEDKTKREIAILKKVRHPNVVGLLEIIDDPELKKIYMVLEHVELGEITWRKKGSPSICARERYRIERELQGEPDTGEDALWFKTQHDRFQRKEAARERLNKHYNPGDYWSLEHGMDEDDDLHSIAPSRQSTQEFLGPFAPRSYTSHTSMVRSNPASGSHSRATSRAPSRSSSTAAHTPMPTEFDIGPIDSDNENEDPGPLPSIPSTHSSAAALDAQLVAHVGDQHQQFRGRSPSMADSVISHMSSVDVMMAHDAFEEDFSYVPCFTFDQARSTFRDTVLGLEYLHYQGIVHRDIKPSNLLWTRDHRVKISDFGVSYFGRPIRDGEMEEYISESDALDFDDDLELAKTVGTPAFFAPELCYTDLDVEQPKITEQIDVWSLGVTLYCLIYARIPFLAEDEYQLFRAIAHQDVHIPKRRLKPVNPQPCLASSSSLSKPTTLSDGIYRDENEFLMEDIDEELYDLIRRMLIKDPVERMKLREVKRHPWVLRGVDNVIGWLDDTDPSRKTAGRRIQVDDKELERAVVPITFLERARSAVKKTVVKVFGRTDGSRRRAVSSATSSGTDISQSTPATPMKDRDARRASMRVDESYFSTVREPREPGEHPLAQSVTCSPQLSATDENPFNQQFPEDTTSAMGTPRRKKSETELSHRPGLQERTNSTATSIQTVIHRLSHSRSFSDAPSPVILPLKTVPETPFTFTDHNGGMIRDSGRSLHDTRSGEVRAQSSDSHVRPRSVDRALFTSNDKHSDPVVSLSTAVAPGKVEHSNPRRHLYTRSTEISPSSPEFPHGLHSTHLFRPSGLSMHQQSASASDVPMLIEKMYAASIIDDRPSTATRTPEGRTPPPRIYHQSTPESFARAREQLERRQRLEEEMEEQREQDKQPAETRSDAPSTCPPSPDDDNFQQRQAHVASGAKSSSSINFGDVVSAVTSPSEIMSPTYSSNYSSANLNSCRLGSSSEQIFPSDPSLPTLMSGASSVSADHEGDFLSQPGVVHDTVDVTGGSPDTMTPPALSKEPSHDNEHHDGIENLSALPVVADDDDGYTADGDLATKTDDDDYDDSDSDEGLTMSRKKPSLPKRQNTLVRRDTNASVGSTETAKKISTPE